MKIQNSVITMTGSSSTFEAHSREESLKMWVGDRRPNFEGDNPSVQTPQTLTVDTVEISAQSKALHSKTKCVTGCVEDEGSIELDISDQDKLKLLLIQKMLEHLTGKKLNFFIPEKIMLKKSNDLGVLPDSTDISEQQPLRAGWGLEYDYHESNYEQQKMSFSSQGIVKTADGKEIRFSLDLNMSREFASRTDISVRAGDALKKDPLVINFDAATTSLSDAHFSFDLDCDGKSDQISFLSSGSGFLSLDLNNDGKINNGSELFGPKSGDGFADLASYDDDGNKWIDENDSIYDKLRIWTKDEKGNDVLYSLGQKGIGAIYLGNISTNFSLKDHNNNLQGEIQKTGIFLKENGTAGSIQHVDLAI